MKIAIFGDSHAALLNSARTYSAYDVIADMHIYRGASLVGLGRRTSTLGVHLKIAEILEKKEHAFYVFKFGQVDVDLGFYYKLLFKEPNLVFSDFTENTINAYGGYLSGLDMDKNKLIVHTINLPSIIDQRLTIKYTNRIIAENAEEDQVRTMKKRLADIIPTVVERTRRTMFFNQKLKTVFGGLGITVTDPTPRFINPGSGLLDDCFVLGKQDDHHYADTLLTRKIFAESLLSTIINSK